MIRSIAIATLALSAALINPADAQSRPVTFGVSGGASIPLSKLGDSFDVGYSVAGHVSVRPASMGQLGLRGDLSYDRWTAKSYSNTHLSSLGVVGNLIVPVGDNTMMARPYVLGGAGWYHLEGSSTVSAVTVSSSSNNVGFQAGGGLEFKLGELSTFLEAKYVAVLTDGDRTMYVPITFGIRF